MTPRKWLLAAVIAAAGVARAGTFEDIRELTRDLSVATWTGDAVWFEENLADEYLLIAPNGDIRTKRQVIQELTTSGLKMDPYEPMEVHVRVYGNSAIVTGRIVQRFTVGGMRYTRHVRFTDVYVKRKSRWLLVSGHSSAITPAAAGKR